MTDEEFLAGVSQADCDPLTFTPVRRTSRQDPRMHHRQEERLASSEVVSEPALGAAQAEGLGYLAMQGDLTFDR